MSSCLAPDQDRHSVGPDLGQTCMQRLSADDKSRDSKERVNVLAFVTQRLIGCQIFATVYRRKYFDVINYVT